MNEEEVLSDETTQIEEETIYLTFFGRLLKSQLKEDSSFQMLKIEFSVKLFVHAQIRRMLQQNWFGVMPALHG